MIEKQAPAGDDRGAALARQARTFAVVAAAYFLSARLGLALMPAGVHMAVVWPPSGVAVAALLFVPGRQWAAAGAGIFCANLAANLLGAQPGPLSLAYAAVNLLEPFLVAALLRRLLGGFDSSTPRRAALFLCVVAGGTAVAGAAGAAIPALYYGDSFWSKYLQWVVADSVGIFVVTPLLLLWREALRTFGGSPVSWRHAEYVASLGALAVLSTVRLPYERTTVDFDLLGLAILTRIAFTVGMPGVTVALFVQATALIVSDAARGEHLIGIGQSVASEAISSQIFLLAAVMVSHVFAATFSEQRRLRRVEQESVLVLRRSLDLLSRSEEKYRTVADNTYDWENWVGADGEMLYVSPSCERVTGYRAEEFLADPGLHARLAHPEDRDRWSRHARVLQVGKRDEDVHEVDCRILTRAGEERWIAHICRQVYALDGRDLGRRASNRDITDRKRAEAELQERTAVLNAVFETVPFIMLLVDEEGRVLMTNRSGGDFSGMTKQEMLNLLGGEALQCVNARGERGCGAVPACSACPVRTQMEHTLLTGESLYDREGRFTRLRDGREIAFDFLISTSLVAVERARAVLVTLVDISALKRSEVAVRRSELLFRSIFNNMAVGMALLDLDGHIQKANQALAEFLGEPAQDLAGRLLDEFISPESRANDRQLHAELSAGTRESYSFESSCRRRDKTTGWGRLSVSLWRDEGDRPQGKIVVVEDVTAEHGMQEQIVQAQKMEAVGTLAGGIAHDINNVLNVIKGYGFLLERGATAGSANADHLREVMAAANRGAELTGALLTFSRRSTMNVTVLNLNEVVRGMHAMIERILGESVAVEISLAPESPLVEGDAGQLGQVLMNFATNARDAMPRGGRLRIATEVLALPAGLSLPEFTLPAGGYALFRVEDTGLGIPEDVRRRIFDPFFTTKAAGQGTGLGLAVVFGIVKQHKGYVACASPGGGGTAFTVYLPLFRGEAPPAIPAVAPRPGLPGGSERLLVAEDDAAGREMVALILRGCGYRMTVARDGGEALELFKAAPDAFDLLILDIVMPGLSGLDVLREARLVRPSVPVLLMSGYSDELIREKGLDSSIPVMHKPLQAETLCSLIRERLDAAAPEADGSHVQT